MIPVAHSCVTVASDATPKGSIRQSIRRIDFLSDPDLSVMLSCGYESLIFVVFHRRLTGGDGRYLGISIRIDGSFITVSVRSSGSIGSFFSGELLYTGWIYHTFHTTVFIISGKIL